MKRPLVLFAVLLAALAVSVPTASAQRPDRSDLICERDPNSPRCEHAQELDDRKDEARCSSEVAAFEKAKKAVKKAKRKLKNAKAEGGDVAKAEAKLEKKKAKRKAARAKVKACTG